jgi:16S rRNA (guanine966-N2)-methyltransferase
MNYSSRIAAQSLPQKTSRIKIIAGRMRGRWIEFPDTSAIRPTPNRVRETLFNWLMQRISGACCLDAFSGSGALSLEALSRGAACVYAVERHTEFARALNENAIKLQAHSLKIIVGDFFEKKFSQQFNLIFLDPPFNQNLLVPALNYLTTENLLANNAMIYFEVEKEFDLLTLPSEFEMVKNQVAGQVRYGLLQVVRNFF